MSPARRPVRAVLAVLAAVLVLVAAGCARGQQGTPPRLVIATGNQQDVYRVLGEALGEAARQQWSAAVDVVTTTGSVKNLELVALEQADVGFATVDTAALARFGNPPFDGALPIVALARIYDDFLQVVTLAEEGAPAELADLAGRRVSLGAAGSGTDIVAQLVLDAAGVELGDQVYAGPRTSADALIRGEIDAFFVAGGLPTPAVSALAEQAPVQLLSLQDLVGDLQDRHGEYYLAASIPADTYGIPTEVATVSVPTVLVVREDLPETTAYEVTKLLFAAKPALVAAHQEARRLDSRSALATYPIALHPGAQRYYRTEKPLSR